MSSSSDDGIANLKRKRVLETALFDLFSKKAISSLKRDLSRLCNDSELFRESKRSKLAVSGKDSYSAYHSKYFFEVLGRLTLEQKDIIQKFGYGCLLCLSKTYLPSSFIRWLALSVDTVCSEIGAGESTIRFPKDAFHFLLGLPNSGSRLVEDTVGGRDFLLDLFNLTEVPQITFFGNKLSSKESLSDKQVFACFMQIALSCFLCPSKCSSLDTKFIGQLGDPERARRFDLCSLVHSHTLNGVSRTVNYIQSKGRKPKTFEFCSYGLAVYYLDCLDFGVHVAGTGLPRSMSWRGDMIKMYSDLDRKGRKGYGRRRLRKDLAGCYIHASPVLNKCCAHCGSRDELMSIRLKDSTREKFSSVVPVKIIDCISDTVHRFYSSSAVNSNNPGVLVRNVIKVLADAPGLFQKNIDFQKDTVHSSFAKLSVSPTPATPASGGLPMSDKNCTISAPVVPPVRKVLSRLPAKAHDECEKNWSGQADIKSPVGHIMFSPLSAGKDVRQDFVKPAVQKVSSSIHLGSQQVPIPILDVSPATNVQQKSPDVAITGTSSLKQRQEKFALDTDAVYNRSIKGKELNHVYTSRKSAPIGPLEPDVIDMPGRDADLQKPAMDLTSSNTIIIIQPKNYLALPLEKNPRFPVSDEDIMHYCAMVDIAYTEKVQKDLAIQYYGVHCSWISFGQSLMPDGHIDNFLIPCLCRKLFEDWHPSKSGRHYFFSYIGESILSYNINNEVAAMVRTSFLGAATASKGRRLDKSDRLFFPICHLDHWFTFCVDFKWKLFVFLDSYYSPDSHYQRSVRGRLVENFVTLWHDIFQTNEPDFNIFKVWTGEIPKQGNNHDCGVMTMMAMEFYDPSNDLKSFFSKDDIPHIRIQYANRLFFHHKNKTDTSLVTKHYDKAAFMRRLKK